MSLKIPPGWYNTTIKYGGGSRGHIEGFRNIPVDELRERILEGYGFDAYNFAGGFRFYDAVMHDRALIEMTTPCGMDR